MAFNATATCPVYSGIEEEKTISWFTFKDVSFSSSKKQSLLMWTDEETLITAFTKDRPFRQVNDFPEKR